MGGRKRLLFLIPNLGIGGAQRVVTTLLQNIDRDRFEPMLGLVDVSNDFFRSQIPPDVAIFDLHGPRVRYALLDAVRLIWRTRPHLVISTLDHLNVAIAATRPLWPPGVRCALRLTNLMALDDRPMRAAMTLVLRLADGLIYQSEAMRQAFDRRLALRGQLSFALPNPVDLDLVRRRAAEAAVTTGYDPTCFNFVAVGRLDPIKGLDLALEAMARIRERRVRLTMVGDGPARAELEGSIRSLKLEGRARLAGFQENPFPYMAQANALVLSSRFEGFPNVVLEALALGVPVAATPVAGMTELLGDAAGCAVAAEISAPALADAMERVVDAAARPSANLVDRFGMKAATRQYEEVFARLIEQPRAGHRAPPNLNGL